jgi:hypothetical protein
VRGASRRAFKTEVQVEVDGGPATLVDLSVTGAQVISPTVLKPNRVVKVRLEKGSVACKGKVVWARLEPSASGSLSYRAGVVFTSVDESAVESFMAEHPTLPSAT